MNRFEEYDIENMTKAELVHFLFGREPIFGISYWLVKDEHKQFPEEKQ